MSLWWLQEGWTDAICANCGEKIWPEGDPDHGVCYGCFMAQAYADEMYAQMNADYTAQMEADYAASMGAREGKQ